MATSSIFIDKKQINAIVSILTGNIATMEALLKDNNCLPIQLARWSGERRGLSEEGLIDSYQLSYAMFDALKNKDLFIKLNVRDMLKLHQMLIPETERTTYDQFGFIIWNWMEEPDDNPYFDEQDEQELLKSGVNKDDIRLTNAGIQHMEKELISLLKAGASPYFLVTTPNRTEAYIDKDGLLRHSYFDVAPMLDVTKMHSCDYWFEFIGDYLENDIALLPVFTLEQVVEGLFNVGACERILHLTEEYISDLARLKGNALMLEYLGEIRSIEK